MFRMYVVAILLLSAALGAASAEPLTLRAAYEQLQAAEEKVEALYARWAELESKQQ